MESKVITIRELLGDFAEWWDNAQSLDKQKNGDAKILYTEKVINAMIETSRVEGARDKRKSCIELLIQIENHHANGKKWKDVSEAIENLRKG